MFYVYIIYSRILNKYYIGQTNDLKRRIIEHKNGKSTFTSRTNDWKLIYYEAFTSRSLAIKRENSLKPRSKAFSELIKRIIDKNGEGWRRAFCRTIQRVNIYGKVKCANATEPKWKRGLIARFSHMY